MLSGPVLSLLLNVMDLEGPQIFAEAEKLFTGLDVSKLQWAATTFLQLANHAATASVAAAKAPEAMPAPTASVAAAKAPEAMPAPPADSPSGAASEPATPAPTAAAVEIMNSADRAARQAEAESVS